MRMTPLKRALIVVCLGVVLAGGVVWWTFSSREPSWEGRTLSEWLEDVDTDWPAVPLKGVTMREFLAEASRKNDAALQAVSKIGREAVPQLRQMLKADNSISMRIEAWLRRQSYFTFTNLPQDIRRRKALFACGALGEVAEPALPDIISCMRDPEPNVRLIVPIILGDIGKRPDIIVPVLMQCLSDTNSGVRGNAAAALQHLGAHAQPAVPALLKLLNDSEEYPREKATNALQTIAPNTMPALKK